ncbi:MAG: nitrous oxide reductase family maturation protein NosD, partial [Rhodospirillaceae bacterium]|nr:nitrous oxide reductase family maturation protein NosD [Rhodospirillaceae bacterium]
MTTKLVIRFVTVVAAILSGIAAAPAAQAMARTVQPGADDLRAVIVAARPGDRLLLAPGIHHGPIILDRSITLLGQDGATIKGNGTGSTIRITAPKVTVRGLTITNSGHSLETMDAGIFIEKTGTGALVEDNRLSGNLFGVYLFGSTDAIVRGNRIVGRTDLRVNERGNGVSLWNAPGAQVIDNSISHGRDGIFVNTSKRNRFVGNTFRNVRIAVHYMYANNSEVSNNLSVGNHVGFALMYSRGLTVRGNISRNDRDHGILLNFTNSSTISQNWVDRGSGKCVFIYNSSKNDFNANRFEGCPIGVHFTAGSERNNIVANAFINNRTQVKYVGSRVLDWSRKGRGNYWSDNPTFDLDGNGIADATYRPNDLVDHVVWRHRRAKLLLNSPAMQILRFAQSRFPALLPGGVMDSAPLMTPPPEMPT